MSFGTDYRENPLARTKIIATVGPACETREALRDLIVRGVDIFRLNFAHGSHEWLSGIDTLSTADLSRSIHNAASPSCFLVSFFDTHPDRSVG